MQALENAYLGLIRIEQSLKNDTARSIALFQLFMLQYSQQSKGHEIQKEDKKICLLILFCEKLKNKEAGN